jgi:hypothetical protein
MKVTLQRGSTFEQKLLGLVVAAQEASRQLGRPVWLDRAIGDLVKEHEQLFNAEHGQEAPTVQP